MDHDPPSLSPNDPSGARPGYTPVPTSAQLKTRGVGQNASHALEALDHATPFGRRVAGHWLAQTHVRSDFVPVLEDVYDRLALDQQAEEQAVYGHLYRLALGDSRNFCRVSRRDLSQRTNLSDRRLGKALAGLVAKKHVALVERDRVGTLYRVILPHEVFGEATPGAVLAVRERSESSAKDVLFQMVVRPAAATPQPSSPSLAKAKEVENDDASKKGGENNRVLKSKPSVERETLTVGQVAAKFVEESGGRYVRSEVVEEIFGRLEEGRTLVEIALELSQFAKAAPKRTPLRDLPRWLKGR